MESKNIDLQEACGCAFQKDWKIRFLGLLLFFIYISILPLIFTTVPNKAILSKAIIVFGIIGIVNYLILIFIQGYFTLYAHDRALNKDAKLREWSECIFDAFIVGLKTMIGFSINSFLIMIISFVFSLVFFVLNFIPVLGQILSFILVIVLFCISINFMCKLYVNYLKDLKLISWFQWKKALNLNKEMKFGKLKIFLAILTCIGVLIINLIISGIISIPLILIKNAIVVIAISLIITAVSTFFFWFMNMLWANIFGQYTYNAISKKINSNPENLPNIINQDKTVTLIIALIFLTLFSVSIILSINSFSKLGFPMMGISHNGNMNQKYYEDQTKYNSQDSYSDNYENEYNSQNSTSYNNNSDNYNPTDYTEESSTNSNYNNDYDTTDYSDSNEHPKEYSCIYQDGGTTVYDRYSPNAKPTSLSDCNDSFFYSTSEKREECQRRKEIKERMYRNGECKEIIKKYHQIDGCECEVELDENGKVTGSGCGGSNECNTDSARDKLNKMYNLL